jgi:peptidoglycan hydrolase FlgJ
MISAGNAATLLNTIHTSASPSGILPDAGMAGRVKDMNDAQIDAVAKNFESMFVSQMLEQMAGDSLGSEAFGDSETNDIYKGLVMEEYGKIIARSGGIGIAPYVKSELLKLQEMSS